MYIKLISYLENTHTLHRLNLAPHRAEPDPTWGSIWPNLGLNLAQFVTQSGLTQG